jgi:hypothetical protein
MGLFFKRKKMERAGVPPPPPPAEGGVKEEAKEKKPIPELPPLESEKHLPSEMPEIKPGEEKKAPSGMPEFPEAPKEEKEAEKEKKAEEVEEPATAEEEVKAPAPVKEIAVQKFVTVSRFQTVLTEADAIRSSIRKAEEVIARINELKKEEEKEFSMWRAQLEDAEKKLGYIDKVIFKGE